MRKYLFILFALVLGACTQNSDPSVSLVVDPSFAADGTATVKVVLSESITSDVLVNLVVGTDAAEGTALPAANLEINKQMIISAGSLSAEQTVSVKTDGLDPGKYQAVIILGDVTHAVAASGKTLGFISCSIGQYGGIDNPGGEDKPGGSGESGNVTAKLRSDWTISYEGYQLVEYSDGEEWNEVFKVTGQGTTPIYFLVVEGGTLESYNGDYAKLLADAEASLQDDLDYYGSWGWTIDDLIVSEDPHYEYYGGFDAGDWEAFAFAMTSEGKCTGDFGWGAFTIAEDHTGEGDEDETTLVDRIAAYGTGNALFTIGIYPNGTLSADNLEASIIDEAQYLLDYYNYVVAMYEAFGFDVDFTLLDFMNDATYNYVDFEAMEEGVYDALIVGLDSDCNPTGQYNISSITIDGHALARFKAARERIDSRVASFRKPHTSHHMLRRVAPREDDPTVTLTGPLTRMSEWYAEYLGRYEEEEEEEEDPETPELDVELALQKNWSVSLVGAPYEEDGYYYVDITVSAPGIQYYWVEHNSQDDLEYWYDGTVEGMVASWQATFQEELADGATLGDLFWSASDPATWMSVYDVGPTTVYIAEFDSKGKATGRYGASAVTIPDFETSSLAPSKIRVRIKR